jgi:hypothetical protein
MPWGYDGPAVWSDARLKAAADYVYQQWLKDPIIARKIAQFEGDAAAARAARLAEGIAQIRNASMLYGAADLALTAGLPIAVWVGVFVALGAPYAQARAIVRNENFRSGFTQGFVASLLNWEWHQVTSRFFRFDPGTMNYFDESLSYIGANAFNSGLHAGYIHACSISPAARKAYLQRLRSLSPSTRAGQWDRLDQINYVIELASAGVRNNVFRSD